MPKTILICALFALCSLVSGCSGAGRAVVDDAPGEAGVEQRWGIRVEGLRLTAGGYMCDFRFRVVDARRAAPLLDRRNEATLLDESTGTLTHVPAMPRVGPLRQTVKLAAPVEGRTYFVLFANPGRLIREGQRATVSIGEFVMPGLLVQ